MEHEKEREKERKSEKRKGIKEKEKKKTQSHKLGGKNPMKWKCIMFLYIFKM